MEIFLNPLRKIRHRLNRLEEQSERQLVLHGRTLTEAILKKGCIGSLAEAEFSVFSQWGEDGIIQYLVSRIPIENKVFIEFGVETYEEANTRFLLLKDNWRGLLIDGDPSNIEAIRSQSISWRYHLDAVASFITTQNINQTIASAGISGDTGMLSIDIDGNDYWIWEAIDTISPRIVIVEYNNLWGGEIAVSVPYEPEYRRTKKHFSNLYYGASLGAFIHLGRKKGYTFVGSTSTGLNAFFVRNDLMSGNSLVERKPGYIQRKFRDGRSESGSLTFDDIPKQLKVVRHLPVVDVITGKNGSVGEFLDSFSSDLALGK